MPSNDGSALPRELDRALKHAIGHAVTSLTTLRQAVHDHVLEQRSLGVDLASIQSDLRNLIARAHDGLEGVHTDGAPHAELSAEIIKWTDGFFVERG
jgi:hypothetical protein